MMGYGFGGMGLAMLWPLIAIFGLFLLLVLLLSDRTTHGFRHEDRRRRDWEDSHGVARGTQVQTHGRTASGDRN